MSPPLSQQSLAARMLRAAKVRVLQAQRVAQWARYPQRFGQAPIASTQGLPVQHRVTVALRGVQSHPILEAGKRTNLAVAAAHFDGRRIDASTPFSFWRLLGKPTASRGYLPGTEIRDGCVIPSVGGGLCLLSGALFRLAAEMDWDIQERHGHTVQGRDFRSVDATVFWPQVDLRFAPKEGSAVLRVRVLQDSLIVESFGTQAVAPVPVWRQSELPQNSNVIQASRVLRAKPGSAAEILGVDHKRTLPAGLSRNCITCQQTGCGARASHLRVVS